MPYFGYEIVDDIDVNTGLNPGEIALGTSFNFVQGQGAFLPINLTQNQALENLKHLLLTRKGEIYQKPTFGSDLLTLIFENTIEEIKINVQDIIKEAVGLWMSYIDIIDILTNIDENNSSIDITIRFAVNDIPSNTAVGISVGSGGTITVNNITVEVPGGSGTPSN